MEEKDQLNNAIPKLYKVCFTDVVFKDVTGKKIEVTDWPEIKIALLNYIFFNAPSIDIHVKMEQMYREGFAEFTKEEVEILSLIIDGFKGAKPFVAFMIKKYLNELVSADNS